MSNQPERSAFIGVYNNTNAKSQDEVPFRSAIKRMFNGQPSWTNLGYSTTELVAARIYNFYAVQWFSKKAILNSLTPEQITESNDEFRAFVEAKPKRKHTYNVSLAKYIDLVKSGHQFKFHTELTKEAA